LIKKYKIIALIVFTSCFISSIYYYSLSNRHKAIIKTKILHKLNIINPYWTKNNNKNTIELTSPSFLIDNVYKSMEGPKSSIFFKLDEKKDKLNWMTNYSINVISNDNINILTNDFFCHFNIDYNDQEHHARWDLLNRVGKQYPRLVSLSNGMEKFSFPEGFGYPFYSNEKFFITTQALNHNITDSVFKIKHKIKISYSTKKLKPLYPKTIYLMLPLEKKVENKDFNKKQSNTCIPVDDKNHMYENEFGEKLSGHWKIFNGKNKYKFDTTKQLRIKDTLTVHQIIPHLHPFAEKFTLIDKTSNKTIYACNVINYQNKIGLKNTPSYSSKKGIKLYPNHKYELELITNNTLKEPQDMMGSLFLFIYDKELDLKMKK
jgi:hypothetical protein